MRAQSGASVDNRLRPSITTHGFGCLPELTAGARQFVATQTRGRRQRGFRMRQRYQRVGGTVTVGGKTQPVLGAALQGDKLSFSFVDSENNLRTARVTVAGNAFSGDLSTQSRTSQVTGRKK